MTGEAPVQLAKRRPLPEGWRWVRLGEICKEDRRIVEAGSELGGRLPYVSLEHLESGTGRILKETTEKVEDEGKSTTFDFDSKHVLYGKLRPYLNKVALPDFRGRCTTELIPITPTQSVSREFLAWLLRRGETVEAAMKEKTGSRMPRANMRELLSLVIPLPPLPEQRRIAAILNGQMAAVERARAAAEAQLEAAKALPSAYLRAVFNSPEANEWPRKRLDTICEIQLGKMLSPKSKTGFRSRPYLRNANVQWNRFDLSEIGKMDFSEREEKKFLLKRGDLLVCEGGEPGRSAVWEGQIEPCCYQKALLRLRPINGSDDPYFIMYRLWFGAVIGEFFDSHAKTTIAHLPAIRLSSLLVSIPSPNEQKQIAMMLNKQLEAAQRARETVEEQLATINQLPAVLLRRALNGEF